MQYQSKKPNKMVKQTITTLERNNILVNIFTNNLAAYESLKKMIPAGITYTLPSYSTVNRAVQKEGDYIDLATPMGIYVIKKTLLFAKSI